MVRGALLAVPVVFLAVIAFWLNEPLPPNTANPIKYKIFAGLVRAHNDLAELQAWLTGEDYGLIEQRHVRAAQLAFRFTDPEVLVSEEKFDGVTVYVYQPKTSSKKRPGMLYYHGGGFRSVHPVSYESMLFKFVKQLNMVVVAVDYRLTPTVKVPVPHEDCEKAARYFFSKAEKYGVDPNKIGAAGDSAGGNVAATQSLKFRDQKGENQFIFQLLIYPWVQGLDLNTPSHKRNCPTAFAMMTIDTLGSYFGSFLGLPPKTYPDLLANRHINPEVWDKYKKYFKVDEIPKDSIPPNYKPVRPKEINKALADYVEDILSDPHLFPLLADDLSHLPPAYVLTVENDPIRDEGIWYANRLKRAGNKVLHDHSQDGFHGMIGFQTWPMVFDAAVSATDKMLTFAQEVLRDSEKNPRKKRTPELPNVVDDGTIGTIEMTETKEKVVPNVKAATKNHETPTTKPVKENVNPSVKETVKMVSSVVEKAASAKKPKANEKAIPTESRKNPSKEGDAKQDRGSKSDKVKKNKPNVPTRKP